MYKVGTAKIIPSILSSKPPWPGIILPVFLTPAFLLKLETIISPVWLTVEIKTVIKKSLK